jgi:hypothetical protein
MPICIAKFTLVLSNANGDCPDPPPEQYKEWHVDGGGVVGNVRALAPYSYRTLPNGRIGVEDDVYLQHLEKWSNRDNSLMQMTRECFEKYFVAIE